MNNNIISSDDTDDISRDGEKYSKPLANADKITYNDSVTIAENDTQNSSATSDKDEIKSDTDNDNSTPPGDVFLDPSITNDEFIAPDLSSSETYSVPDQTISTETVTDSDDSDDSDTYDKHYDITDETEDNVIDENRDSEHENEDEETENRESFRAIHSVFDFIELFVFSLVAVLVATTFIFKHSIVEGGSMENTLFENEHLIISDLFYEPERGDIIVCESELKKPIVKRVIAIAGDHIQVSVTGVVTLNGEILEETYVHTDGPIIKPYVDITVPEGEIFVMGDHRNKSTDSRELGTIDTDCILGKVLLRFYPFEQFGTVE